MIENLTKNIFEITKDLFEPYIALQIFILNRNSYFLTDAVTTQNGFSIENIEDSNTYCFVFYDQICRDTAISILTAADPFSIEYVRKPTANIACNHRQIIITSVSYKNYRILSGFEELVTLVGADDTEDSYNPPAVSYMERYRMELKEAQEPNQTITEECDLDALFQDYTAFRDQIRRDAKIVSLSKIRSVLTGCGITGTHASLDGSNTDAKYKFSYRINENTPFSLFHFKTKSFAERALVVLVPQFSGVHFFIIGNALFIVFDQQKFEEAVKGDDLEDYAKGQLFFNQDGVKKRKKKLKKNLEYN